MPDRPGRAVVPSRPAAARAPGPLEVAVELQVCAVRPRAEQGAWGGAGREPQAATAGSGGRGLREEETCGRGCSVTLRRCTLQQSDTCVDRGAPVSVRYVRICLYIVFQYFFVHVCEHTLTLGELCGF